jgi:hypothetical protein
MQDLKSSPETRNQEATEHVRRAHHLLNDLQRKLAKLKSQPEFEESAEAVREAITSLELALSKLTVNTGGIL